MEKALTVGHSGTEAPANRTGAGATNKEDIDQVTRIVTWGQGELLDMGFSTKKKKKIAKSILKLKEQFPDAPVKELVNAVIDRIEKGRGKDKGKRKKRKLTSQELQAEQRKYNKRYGSDAERRDGEHEEKEEKKKLDSYEKKSQPLDKDLFKSILKKVKENYPGTSFEGIIYITKEVYKKKFQKAKSFTADDAKKVGEKLGIDWDKCKFDVKQFLMGLKVELEHGTKDKETNVTGDDIVKTGKIALAHLKESPDYYTKLKEMEEE